MRRMLILCAVLLFGCAKSEPPASQSTPVGGEGGMATISLADIAGTWDGTVTAAGSDTVLTLVVLTATDGATGWTMKVANAQTPTVWSEAPIRSVAAEGDSVVVESAPFQSVLRPGQEVTTHAVYRLENGTLMGTIQATYPASGETVTLYSVATRQVQ